MSEGLGDMAFRNRRKVGTNITIFMVFAACVMRSVTLSGAVLWSDTVRGTLIYM